MTSRTSPKAFRLNISNFWENYTFHEKEEYHLLDKKIKSFFSTIIEGFIREPLHFWFFKTHFYPFKKKKRFAKVYRVSDGRFKRSNLAQQPRGNPSDMKYRLLNLNIKNKSPLSEGKLQKKSLRLLKTANKPRRGRSIGALGSAESKGDKEIKKGRLVKQPRTYSINKKQSAKQMERKREFPRQRMGKHFSALGNETFIPDKIKYIRKHILRALYLPSLLKRKKLPFNFKQLAKFHHEYLRKNSTFYKSFLQRGGEWLRQGDRRSLKSNKSSKSSKVIKDGKAQKGNKTSSPSKQLLRTSIKDGAKALLFLTKKERILYKRLKEKKRKMKKTGFILPFGEGGFDPAKRQRSNLAQPASAPKMARASENNITVYPHRLFLTYNSNLRMASDSVAAHPPIILGKCQILKAPSIAYVKISYYLDLDQTYTSEITTLLIYRLLASKSYLERVLHMKIKVNLTNYFLFIWKLNIYKPTNFRTGLRSVSRLISNEKKKLKGKNRGLVKEPSFAKAEQSKVIVDDPHANLGFLKKNNKNIGGEARLRAPSLKGERVYGAKAHLRTVQLQLVLLRNERSFFTQYDELIKNIITDLGKWKKNRFFNRTINIIIPMFFYEFDSVLVGNLISFELSNLRKGHGYYIKFLKKTLKKCFSQKKFRKFRKSYSGLPLLNSIQIKLTGRLTKSRRPSTRTQVIGFKIGSSKKTRKKRISSRGKRYSHLSRRARRMVGSSAKRSLIPKVITPFVNGSRASVYIPRSVGRTTNNPQSASEARLRASQPIKVGQPSEAYPFTGRKSGVITPPSAITPASAGTLGCALRGSLTFQLSAKGIKDGALAPAKEANLLETKLKDLRRRGTPTKRIRQRLMQNNPITRADSFQTISYNRFGIINIELVVFYNH